ncbi:hypothetical protein OROGR_008005 [Orobanche gracilis]
MNRKSSTCHYYEIALCIMPFTSIPLAVDMPRHVILSASSRHNTNKNNNMVTDSSTGLDGFGEDDENMVSSSRSTPIQSYKLDYMSHNFLKEKHLRYRTRVFAAECLNHLPEAVGENPAHFDLSLAREQPAKGRLSGDWLVLQLQELISLAYQISTIQFEKMRPIGVSLLCTIMDKFAAVSDPELPDHLLLEQYQAQMVSAVRSALDSLSGPILLEAGLQLATKMLTSGIISRDQVAVKRIFSLISRPLDDFNDLYYPSYAEWVSCKIKVRLLSVHASLKCYMFAFLRRQGDKVPDEYLALLPLFSKSSSILGTYWLSFLKDYSFVRFHLHLGNWKPFLDGIQSSSVSVQLQPCLEEAWPAILQALVLDAVPSNSNVNESSPTDRSKDFPTSGYSMVELRLDDFQFLWGFSLLVLFQEQDLFLSEHIIPVIRAKSGSDILVDDSKSLSSKLDNIFFHVFRFMCTKRFFASGFLNLDACRELMQVFSYLIFRKDTWDCLAVFFISQVVQNCPKYFIEVENFTYLAMELCFTFLFKFLSSSSASSQDPSGWDKVISVALITVSTLLERCEAQMQLRIFLPCLLIGYKCIGETSTERSLTSINDFVQSICSLLKIVGNSELGPDGLTQLVSITRACLNATVSLTNECIHAIHQLENKRPEARKMLLLKLAFSVELFFSHASLAFALHGPGENRERNPVLYRELHFSIQSIQALLTDSSIQSSWFASCESHATKGIGAESNSFLIFYVGELIEDLFVIVLNILENTITREAVAIVGECLKILMLLQTLSKGTDCQKGLIHLLLEAILLIFSTSAGSASQEANELCDIAVKLVSQLAQAPGSATFIRDILLSIPATQRQQLQEIIRASVDQDRNTKPVTSSGPALVIKLPTQPDQNNREHPSPLGPTKEPDIDSSEEDEEDDWDTFQFFPASGNETAPSPEISTSISDYTKTSDYEEHAVSPSPSNMENLSIEDGETHAVDGANQMEEWHDPEFSYIGSRQSDEMVLGTADEDLLPNNPPGQVKEEHSQLFASDLKNTEKVQSNENGRPLLDVPHVNSTEVHDSPSDKHHTENSAECDEPSR